MGIPWSAVSAPTYARPSARSSHPTQAEFGYARNIFQVFYQILMKGKIHFQSKLLLKVRGLGRISLGKPRSEPLRKGPGWPSSLILTSQAACVQVGSLSALAAVLEQRGSTTAIFRRPSIGPWVSFWPHRTQIPQVGHFWIIIINRRGRKGKGRENALPLRMATCDGAQVALQQSLILRPGNEQCSQKLRGGGHFSVPIYIPAFDGARLSVLGDLAPPSLGHRPGPPARECLKGKDIGKFPEVPRGAIPVGESSLPLRE